MRRRWYEIFSMQIVLTAYIALQQDGSVVDEFANAKRVHWWNAPRVLLHFVDALRGAAFHVAMGDIHIGRI